MKGTQLGRSLAAGLALAAALAAAGSPCRADTKDDGGRSAARTVDSLIQLLTAPAATPVPHAGVVERHAAHRASPNLTRAMPVVSGRAPVAARRGAQTAHLPSVAGRVSAVHASPAVGRAGPVRAAAVPSVAERHAPATRPRAQTQPVATQPPAAHARENATVAHAPAAHAANAKTVVHAPASKAVAHPAARKSGCDPALYICSPPSAAATPSPNAASSGSAATTASGPAATPVPLWMWHGSDTGSKPR